MTQPGGGRGVLYVIACGAGAAPGVGGLVDLAQRRDWEVCVVATPMATRFLDLAALEKQTGHPVRSEYRSPDEPLGLPPADAMVVAPATFNTMNKWAAGISDTFALGLLAEARGLGLPVVVLPFVNKALAVNPAFDASVSRLRATGVIVLHGPGGYEPHEPGTGDRQLAGYPWELALDAVETRRSPRSSR